MGAAAGASLTSLETSPPRSSARISSDFADMWMPDVNVLVYAQRQDEAWHASYAHWLEHMIDGAEPFALSVLVAVGFLRIVTSPRIYSDPTPLGVALAVIEEIAAHPRCRLALPARTI